MKIIATDFAVKMHEVTVAYLDSPPDQPALNRVSIELSKGSWTAVIGANGSGKSTFAKAASLICPVTSGAVKLTGDTSVYMILQNPGTQILGETVYEEMGLCMKESISNPEELAARMRRLLDDAGLHVPLTAGVRHLSGGQKQLLNVACSLAAEADMIVFDEATSMLDPDSRRQVLRAAERLRQRGATLLWVTHRPEELGYADRVIVMEQGSIVYDGTCERFFYDSAGGGCPCERFGFEPPYVVAVAKRLEMRGVRLPLRPLFPEQLSQAVNALCLSK